MRWDKKYPEWCPPFSPTFLVPSHSFSILLAPYSPAPAPLLLSSYYHHSSQHQHQREHQHQRQAAAAAAAAAPSTPSAIGLEYQGCLHRVTGLHHCLRRSANYQQPTSTTPALSLHPSSSYLRSSPAASLLLLRSPSRGQTPPRI